MRSVQEADVLLGEERCADCGPRAPGAAGAHLLALPHPRHAGAGASALHRRGALRGAAFRPLKLLTFHAPEYELEPDHGVVRWRIAAGPAGGARGTGERGAPADRRAPLSRRRTPAGRACTSRWRSRTSTPRSLRGSAAASTTPPSRASTCSSRTASCARSRAWTSRSRGWGALGRTAWKKRRSNGAADTRLRRASPVRLPASAGYATRYPNRASP